eukprot:3341932-Alexandrium_andersonii.AAC.1
MIRLGAPPDPRISSSTRVNMIARRCRHHHQHAGCVVEGWAVVAGRPGVEWEQGVQHTMTRIRGVG